MTNEERSVTDDTLIDVQEVATMLRTSVDGARAILKRNRDALPTTSFGQSRKRYVRRGDVVAFMQRSSVR